MNVALIELYPSHDECLYSQIRFLKAGGFTVHLVCNTELRPRVQDLDLVDHFYFLSFGAGAWKDFLKLLALRRYLLRHHITIAVLNTARGSRVRNLLLLPNRLTRFIGIGHIANKIFSGFTSRLMTLKMKKYFVLNDYILPQLPRRDRIQVSSIYPIFFAPYQSLPLEKSPQEFWVCIPGGIEFARKDYDSLLAGMLKYPLDSRIKFILLGKSNLGREENRNFIQQLGEHGLDKHFVWFEDFVDPGRFFSYLQNCQLILPLIHPKKARYAEYITYKISGAFNLAFGLHIPMLCENSFNGFEDFKESSFFYDEDELVPALNNLLSRKEEIKEKSEAIRGNAKFQFDYQQQNYVRFITS